MADSSPKLSSQSCYDSTGKLQPFDIPCGGKWEKSGSSLCCPGNYQCMKNGLCMLPDDQTVSNASGTRNYSPLDPARQIAAWVQLPTCTSPDWQKCAFDPLACDNDGQSITAGFFPKDICPVKGDRTIQSGDWLSCGSTGSGASTCKSTRTAYNNWGPLEEVLCPAGRDQFNTSTFCTGTPYGVQDPTKAGSWTSPDGQRVPLVIIVPIVIFACIGPLAWLTCFLVRRRRKRAFAAVVVVRMDRRSSHDSWDQGLPVYERHASGGPEWSVMRSAVGETVWSEPPPDYCLKQPEPAHGETVRNVEVGEVEVQSSNESTSTSQGQLSR